ncbi:hypothetical protein Cylst_4588 [Cylindrospermum stagnale PCC 7417]|uniref:Secreted protein n=1 Tax=Cylindrospermum stagnale PCC 7417 TaxID=56107 RepID=K9X3N1_9NOST|nr:hypothetical protein [Cylindrospermum stagnale]AFZ26661.1 hypothetical protein Cylst_4588 [Cylindrospermum stagnale PCC 7417]
MLKPLLLSGWFRRQPFLKYCVVAILIAPLVGASGHSTSAKQSEVAKITSLTVGSDSVPKEVAAAGEPNLNADQTNSLSGEAGSAPVKMATIGEPQLLPANEFQSLPKEDNSHSSSSNAAKRTPLTEMPVSQLDLVQRLKAAKLKHLAEKDNFISSSDAADPLATVAPTVRESQPTSTIETAGDQQPEESQTVPADPIGSPHPIPWKWITVTQESVGGKGGSGVRYYRSMPVVSPDGQYAVYSRVQLEVKPEMYNSRVTSVLFVQDRQTKRLRVMAATSPVSDPLLKTQAVSLEETEDTNGTIGVLVPVSWSEKGDRFLARKFEGVFNTADSTDRAVIWDRQQNQANTVAPAQEEDEHEKIAVLLGWSKSQPNNVLFRAGELGEENWPLVQVASDGKTVTTTTDADQPITFGERLTQVWAEPQVASR